jgi:hypothetical protein
MKIPFNWYPGSWGLRGKTRKIAEAEYYYEGYDLEAELIRINIDDANERDLKMIDLALKYKTIDEYSADIRRADITYIGNDKQLALSRLDIDLKYGKITQQEYDRKVADLNDEPYMSMPKISWDPANPSKTYFELDYNEQFVTFLEQNGYSGSEEDIINKWLNDICNSILDEMPINENDFIKTVKSVRRDDGLTEHS